MQLILHIYSIFSFVLVVLLNSEQSHGSAVHCYLKPLILEVASQPTHQPLILELATQPTHQPLILELATQPTHQPLILELATQPTHQPLIL